MHVSVLIITRAYDVARHYFRLARFSADLHGISRTKPKRREEKKKRGIDVPGSAKRTTGITKRTTDISRDENIAYQANYM